MLKMMMIESTYGGFEDKKDFKTVKELKRDCFPNYFVMGLELFEIFCKGKILHTFRLWTCFLINLFLVLLFFIFFTKNVANSVIGAKTRPSMSCYQVMNLITETNEPHPITPKHTLLLSNSRVSPPNRLNFV